MRRFRSLVLAAPGERVVLDAATSHHMLRVSGIAPGELVELFDGEGFAVLARLIGVEDGLAVLRGTEEPRVDLPGAAVILLASLLKQQSFDTLVRMAVELGVTELRPVLAARSVARGDRSARWERIAQAAAAQCGRADVPAIRAPARLVEAMAGLPEGTRRLVCVPGADILTAADRTVAVLLGPEGGLTDEELELACAAGFATVGLGPRVLRGDTAGAAALARLLP